MQLFTSLFFLLPAFVHCLPQGTTTSATTLKYCSDADLTGDCRIFSTSTSLATSPAPLQLLPAKCENLWQLDRKITSFQVDNGCCAFYGDRNCGWFLFSATNRGDMHIKSSIDNDSIESWMCNTDCEAMPEGAFKHGAENWQAVKAGQVAPADAYTK
ncbi:hypothetical protein EDC01DRAFT_635983 [Geopyxis carbonaria]|nr:hypothetical protein EDC01DRAFT_635983 [Geopyxis carbonaria]